MTTGPVTGRQFPDDSPVTVVKSHTALEVAMAHDLRAVAIVAVRKDGVVDVATYGDTPFEKDAIADWTQRLLGDTITRVPFQTAFGYGTGGVPTALEAGALESLRPGVREYCERFTHPDAVQPPDDGVRSIRQEKP